MSVFYFDAEKIKQAHANIRSAFILKGVANAASGFVCFECLAERLVGASNNKTFGIVAFAICASFSLKAGADASKYLVRLQVPDILKLIETNKFLAKKTNHIYLTEPGLDLSKITVKFLIDSENIRFNFSIFVAAFTAPLTPAIGYFTLVKGIHLAPDNLLPMALILPAATCGFFIRSAVRRFSDVNEMIKRLSLPSPP
jgi:hypothetical protein